VVSRPRLTRKYPELTEQAEAVIDYLRAAALFVAGEPTQALVPDDSDDDAVIAGGLEGHVDYIVSGDDHLLMAACYGTFQILSPRAFPEFFSAQDTNAA
jgi:uncharacterized protein